MSQARSKEKVVPFDLNIHFVCLHGNICKVSLRQTVSSSIIQVKCCACLYWEVIYSTSWEQLLQVNKKLHDFAESAQISLHQNKIEYWSVIYCTVYELTAEVEVLNSQSIKECGWKCAWSKKLKIRLNRILFLYAYSTLSSKETNIPYGRGDSSMQWQYFSPPSPGFKIRLLKSTQVQVNH